jgi:enoyl-[acyl-carrier-protein] reductase (NADH)
MKGGADTIIMINSMSVRIISPASGYAQGRPHGAAQTMAKELGAHGIRVNSVIGLHLGRRPRRLLQDSRERGTTPGWSRRDRLAHLPRTSPSAESGTVVFFASDLSRAVTGRRSA